MGGKPIGFANGGEKKRKQSPEASSSDIKDVIFITENTNGGNVGPV